MIGHWEEMEKDEEEKGGGGNKEYEKGRRRKSSKKMSKLMEKFEEGGGGTKENVHSSQLEGEEVIKMFEDASFHNIQPLDANFKAKSNGVGVGRERLWRRNWKETKLQRSGGSFS